MNISTWVTLEQHACGECGVQFAMPDTFVAKRREDGQTFYCPNGHARVFRPSEAQRLRDELARTKQIAEARQMSIDHLNEYSSKMEIRAESAKRAAKRANQKLKALGEEKS